MNIGLHWHKCYKIESNTYLEKWFLILHNVYFTTHQNSYPLSRIDYNIEAVCVKDLSRSRAESCSQGVQASRAEKKRANLALTNYIGKLVAVRLRVNTSNHACYWIGCAHVYWLLTWRSWRPPGTSLASVPSGRECHDVNKWQLRLRRKSVKGRFSMEISRVWAGICPSFEYFIKLLVKL